MEKTKTYTAINVRFPPDLLAEMRQLAEQNSRSLNGEIVWAIREYVKQQKKEAQVS